MRTLTGPLAVAASFAFFAARLVLFVDQHAVNILFWDQWDFLAGLREGAGPWTLFSWIHGPHRMGLGYLFIAAVYRASAWSDRALGFAIAGVLVAACCVLLALKRRISGSLSVADACIPALVFTTAQFEILIATPNAAHGSIPLLLVSAAPLLWVLRSPPLRAVLGGLLAFCATYTAFAIFLAPCLAVVFAADAVAGTRTERRWNIVGAVLCIAALGSFFLHYRFSPAVDCFQFPDPHPLQYAPFAAMMTMRPLHTYHLARIAPLLGVLGGVLIAAMGWRAAIGLRRQTLLDRTVFLFTAFSLLFIADSAVGRVCLGMPGAFASRYVPYVVPLWLAAYFALDLRASRLRLAASALAAMMVIVEIFVPDDRRGIRWYSEGKARWRACFLATGDETACDQKTNFRVYAVPHAPQVEKMREFLKANRLNLYKP